MQIDPINDLKITQLIKIIKKKVFSPKVTVITDTKTGNRSIIPAVKGEERDIPENLKDYIEEADGWDLADKSYVDNSFKILKNEMLQYVSNIPNPISSSKSSSSNSKKNNSNLSILFSKGELKDNNTIVFFSPAVHLKDCSIIDYTIVCNNEISGDVKLNLVYVNKEKKLSKTNVFSATKLNTITSGENRIKIEGSKALVFELEGPVQNIICNLQINVEY